MEQIHFVSETPISDSLIWQLNVSVLDIKHCSIDQFNSQFFSPVVRVVVLNTPPETWVRQQLLNTSLNGWDGLLVYIDKSPSFETLSSLTNQFNHLICLESIESPEFVEVVSPEIRKSLDRKADLDYLAREEKR